MSSFSPNNPHPLIEIAQTSKPLNRRWLDSAFRWFCMATAGFSVVILGVLLTSITLQGFGHLNQNFLTHYPEPDPEKAGIGPALWGTIWVCLVCGVFTLPIGVATAIFLEEFSPRNRWMRRLHSVIQLNINNLAGVPSVVYGILGLTLFVNMGYLMLETKEPAIEFGVTYCDQFFTAGKRAVLVPVAGLDAPATVATQGMQLQTVQGDVITINTVKSRRDYPTDPELLDVTLIEGRKAGRIAVPRWYYFRVPFGRSVLAGALTLVLVILPVVIISSQEAIRSVPSSLREAGLGIGATPWQVVRNVTLPAAIPGIMTGSILAMSRAIGEAAPILILAGAIFISTNPSNLMDEFTVMPLQIYDWASRPQRAFHELAASGIIVLVAILLVFNSAAVLIRQYTQKRLS